MKVIVLLRGEYEDNIGNTAGSLRAIVKLGQWPPMIPNVCERDRDGTFLSNSYINGKKEIIQFIL